MNEVQVFLVQYFHALGRETMSLPVVLLPQHLVPRNGRRECTLVLFLNRHACLSVHKHTHAHAHVRTHTRRERSRLPHREQAVWRELQFPCWNLCLYIVCCSLSLSVSLSFSMSSSLSCFLSFTPTVCLPVHVSSIQ